MTVARKTALVTGGAGFIGSHMVDLLIGRGYAVRVIDNMIGGREANIAHHKDNPDFTFAPSDIREYQPGHALFDGVDYVFHFAASATSCPRSSGRWNTCRRTRRAPCTCWNAPARLALPSSSMRRRPPATGWRRRRPRGPSDRPAISYALSKYQGEQAAFHWHNVYKLPVNSIRIFNARHALAHLRGLRGGVRCVPEAEARRQAVHRRRRRHADARLSLRDGYRRSLLARGRDR